MLRGLNDNRSADDVNFRLLTVILFKKQVIATDSYL